MTEAILFERIVISFYGTPETASAEDDMTDLIDRLEEMAKSQAPPGLEVQVEER